MKNICMMNNPRVYLIGSGPGDLGLLTLKAAEIIKNAEVVIYDNLVNTDILELAPKGCELVYVGKQSSKHTLSQDEINELLVEKSKQYKLIVRLKGGDPFIFGRGSEEAQYLSENNVAFDIIPGVSSALAVPAYAGIPITDRRFTSSFTVVTGHEDPSKVESLIDWEAIAKNKGTLVVLMGVKNLDSITKKLIASGRNPDEPSCLIRWGTKPEQSVLTASLKDISVLAKEKNFLPPSIFVSGEVVNLRKTLKWFENYPLFSKNIVITRAKEQSVEIKAKLKELGANVIEFPTIKIDKQDTFDIVDDCIDSINDFDWLVFTSVNGVKHFFDRLYFSGFDSRKLGGLKIAAIGTATAKELKNYGINADFIPERFLSEEIISGLSAINQLKNRRFLLFRADIARKNIVNNLLSEGAFVKDVSIYKTLISDETQDRFIRIVNDYSIDAIVFTSPSTVENFLSIVGEGVISKSLKNVKIVSIGPITSDKCREVFNRVDLEADRYDINGVVKVLYSHFKCK